MKMLSALRPGIVVLLLVTAIYAVPIRWIETRRLIPLDMPISFSNGHFQTGEFKINFDAVYYLNFERPVDSTSDISNCADRARYSAKWTVFKKGQPIFVAVPSTSIEYPWRRVDWFRAGPGTYSIDVEALPRAECLNVVGMRLVVEAYDVDFGDVLNLLWSGCVFLGGIGIVLLIRSKPASFLDKSTDQPQTHPRISQSPGYTRNFGARKRRSTPLFHSLPDFGLMHIAVALSLLVVFLFFSIEHQDSMGFKVQLLRSDDIRRTQNAHTKPLRVWLNTCAEYVVNEKTVSRGELQDIVRYELAHRDDPTVYFEADGNPLFNEIAFAMNEIRLAGGKVVWIIPKTQPTR